VIFVQAFAQLRLATPFSPALPWQNLKKLNDRRVAEGWRCGWASLKGAMRG
jgi:hypothetical protein